MPASMAREWRQYLWLFPFIAGTVWLSTLLTLLVYWLASGRPRLPLQSNPYIAFISDIGAFHLKPVFIAGCTITALAYIGTVFSVHYARYSPLMYGLADARWRKIVSALALVSGLVACGGLLLLTIFDTYRFHKVHAKLLLVCFAGLGTSMLSTTAVWFDQTWKPSRFHRLRRWCVVSNVLVLCEVVLGSIFTGFEWSSYYRTAGILEWIMTFTGGFYLLCFVGYLWGACEFASPTKSDEERQPLIAESRDL